MEENFHIQSSQTFSKISRTNFLCNGLARIGTESELGRSGGGGGGREKKMKSHLEGHWQHISYRKGFLV